jgi:nickel transport protein
MKRIFISLSIMLLSVTFSFAHDVRISVEFAPPSVIIKSFYSGDEPISYASVLVFSPSDSGTEYQNGRSDANGLFAFVPDKEGEWKFIIDDEMGHKQEKVIRIEQGFLEGKIENVKDGQLSTYWKAFIGISLIIGCTGIFFWVKARKALKAENKR